MTAKYRIRKVGNSPWPWRVYPPGQDRSLGSYASRKRALLVAEAHAAGANCEPFLNGYCTCRLECAR